VHLYVCAVRWCIVSQLSAVSINLSWSDNVFYIYISTHVRPEMLIHP